MALAIRASVQADCSDPGATSGAKAVSVSDALQPAAAERTAAREILAVFAPLQRAGAWPAAFRLPVNLALPIVEDGFIGIWNRRDEHGTGIGYAPPISRAVATA